MTHLYIYLGIGFGLGIGAASVVFVLQWIKLNKSKKSLEGFLESERLIRERLQKENGWLQEQKEIAHSDHSLKIQELKSIIKMMDEDILLLQKSNEQTEAMLLAGDPAVHTLKLKLLEANNTIARFKGQVTAR